MPRRRTVKCLFWGGLWEGLAERGFGGDVLDCGVYGAGGEEAGEVGGGEFVVCCCCCCGTFGGWGFGDEGFLEGGFLWLVIIFSFPLLVL